MTGVNPALFVFMLDFVACSSQLLNRILCWISGMSMAAANMFPVFPFGLLAAVLGNPVC